MHVATALGTLAIGSIMVSATMAGSGDEGPGVPRPLSVNPLYAEAHVSYQMRCAPCHGETGDGLGDVGRLFLPRPRVFGAGVYKLRSTPSGTLPLDSDLERTIRSGVHGTAMAPWSACLTDLEVRSLVRHVKSLSPRFAREAPGVPIAIPAAPPADAQRVARGRALYERLDCASCHGPAGRGDGPLAAELRHQDGTRTPPRDLTAPGAFKSGAGREDVYRALATGLDGTRMGPVELPPDDRWALVDYVMSLSTAEVRP